MDYEVWMSHKGTMPVNSKLTALENCIEAVNKCDMFLGIITTQYGSSGAADISFTHEEMKKAIELNKPRWLLAHEHVVFARQLLRDLGYDNKEKRKVLGPLKKRAMSLSDLRVIDMYEDATRNDIIELPERKGNWVQKFQENDDALMFAVAQFTRYQEVEKFIQENLKNSQEILQNLKKGAEVSGKNY